MLQNLIHFYSSLNIPFAISLPLIVMTLQFFLIPFVVVHLQRSHPSLGYLLRIHPPYLSFSLSLTTYRNTSQRQRQIWFGQNNVQTTFESWWYDYDSLGARGHLSRGDIEVTLRFFKQFIHTLSRGYMVESFAMYPLLWSQCKQWSHAGYFWNVPPKVATGDILNENPGFFHNFVCNVSTMGLSHSLGLLSKCILKCDHNVPRGFFSK